MVLSPAYFRLTARRAVRLADGESPDQAEKEYGYEGRSPEAGWWLGASQSRSRGTGSFRSHRQAEALSESGREWQLPERQAAANGLRPRSVSVCMIIVTWRAAVRVVPTPTAGTATFSSSVSRSRMFRYSGNASSGRLSGCRDRGAAYRLEVFARHDIAWLKLP